MKFNFPFRVRFGSSASKLIVHNKFIIDFLVRVIGQLTKKILGFLYLLELTDYCHQVDCFTLLAVSLFQWWWSNYFKTEFLWFFALTIPFCADANAWKLFSLSLVSLGNNIAALHLCVVRDKRSFSVFNCNFLKKLYKQCIFKTWVWTQTDLTSFGLY